MANHLVYFVRSIPPQVGVHERASDELRYSLRSVAANLLGLGEVHVFGGAPAWLGPDVVHHRVRQTGSKHDNTWRLWQAIADACEHGELPDEFQLMNDDFFCMEPTVTVPAMTHGTVGEWVKARRAGRATHLAAVMEHTRDVLSALRSAGSLPTAADCPSFELHVPLPCTRETFAHWIPRLAEHVRKRGRIAKRTAYANLAGLAAGAVELAADVKVRSADEPAPVGPWWSTSDEAFRSRRKGVGQAVRDAFVSPSRFEVDVRYDRGRVVRATPRDEANRHPVSQ